MVLDTVTELTTSPARTCRLPVCRVKWNLFDFRPLFHLTRHPVGDFRPLSAWQPISKHPFCAGETLRKGEPTQNRRVVGQSRMRGKPNSKAQVFVVGGSVGEWFSAYHCPHPPPPLALCGALKKRTAGPTR